MKRKRAPERFTIQAPHKGTGVEAACEVSAGMLTVRCPLGSKTAHMSALPARTLAAMLLSEILSRPQD